MNARDEVKVKEMSESAVVDETMEQARVMLCLNWQVGVWKR